MTTASGATITLKCSIGTRVARPDTYDAMSGSIASVELFSNSSF